MIGVSRVGCICTCCHLKGSNIIIIMLTIENFPLTCFTSRNHQILEDCARAISRQTSNLLVECIIRCDEVIIFLGLVLFLFLPQTKWKPSQIKYIPQGPEEASLPFWGFFVAFFYT
jgi:hypothetical protein